MRLLNLSFLLLCLSVNSFAFTLTSPAFKSGDRFPLKYSCQGDNISPGLKWHHKPKGTKSWILVMNDPDVPYPNLPQAQKKNLIHWVLYDIPQGIMGLPSNVQNKRHGKNYNKIKYGINYSGKTDYRGPCPPAGSPAHLYIFRLCALNIKTLGLPPNVTYEKLQAKMHKARKHIIACTGLIAFYSLDPNHPGRSAAEIAADRIDHK